MKKWKQIVTALGAAMMLYGAGSVSAFEPFYLNGDQTQPMIQNTGGIYNDGKTGLFMDLTTMTIEGVFNDGLAVRVKIFELAEGKSAGTGFLHVRYAEDGKAWVRYLHEPDREARSSAGRRPGLHRARQCTSGFFRTDAQSRCPKGGSPCEREVCRPHQTSGRAAWRRDSHHHRSPAGGDREERRGEVTGDW